MARGLAVRSLGLLLWVGCGEDVVLQPVDLVGEEGQLSFNLEFDNASAVDVDLHLTLPSGTEIFWNNPEAEGGRLDVDCHCSSCPQGGNENIYWEDAAEPAPVGTYIPEIHDYGDCAVPNATSNWTFRVTEGAQLVEERSGTIGPGQIETFAWTVD